MNIMEFLDNSSVHYDLSEHIPVFGAQKIAQAEHEPGKFVAKPVIVKVDGRNMMFVLPACYKIDLKAIKELLGAKKVDLVEENELSTIFEDCELGAEPPFGNLYNLPVIMDKALTSDDHIMFQAGTYDHAIRLNMDDYRKLVEPKILDFSYHMR